jgi:GntR family transcriptional regulator
MADPMWKQIAESLRDRIESGDLGRDSKPLPTELELQDEYGASRNTVRDAIKWLVTRGMVYTRSGQGTFVAQKVEPLITKLSTELSVETGSINTESKPPGEVIESVPRVEIIQAAGVCARELRLPEGTSVVSRHQQRFMHGVPYSLQTTFYSMSLVEQGATRLIQAKDIADGAVRYIEEVLHIRQAGWLDRFIVRVPDATETAFFGLPDDGRIAAIEIIRTGYDESGQPFRVTVTTYPADRNQFVMTSGTVPNDLTQRSDETGNNPSAGIKA